MKAAVARLSLPADILIAAALLLVTVAAHLSALDGWWSGDDPQVILHALRNSPAETLFVPGEWQTLSTSSFTPLVTLSFDLDHALFGLRPLFFYQHQLLAIAVAALLLFLLLQPIAGRWVAWLTAAAAATGPAMALAAETLMIRHYVEGLVFALAALIVWRAGDASTFRPLRDSAAAALYLVAMLAKEVYAPLPLLFLADALIRRAPLRPTILRLVPSTIAAAAYLVWRTWMLGSFGGYAAGEVGLSRATFWHLYQALFASSPDPLFLVFPLLALVGIAVAFWKAPRQALILLVASAGFVVIPILGVAGLAEARYGVVPAMVAVVLIGCAFSLVAERVAIVAVAVLFAASLASGIELHANLERARAVEQAEGRWVWTAPKSAAPLLAGAPGWYLEGLADLRELGGGGAAPRFLLSREAIVLGAIEPEQVVVVDDPESPPRHLDPDVLLYLVRERQRFDASIPLEVGVEKEDSVLRWSVGPDEGASFLWLALPGYDEYGIPPRGSRRIPRASERQEFRIRKTLPDGRWTASPPLVLPEKEGRVESLGAGDSENWNRGGA